MALLTELLADDGARRVTGDRPLRRALVLVGSAGEPGAYADAGGVNPDAGMLEQRLERLEPGRSPLTPAARLASWIGTVLIVGTPVVIHP